MIHNPFCRTHIYFLFLTYCWIFVYFICKKGAKIDLIYFCFIYAHDNMNFQINLLNSLMKTKTFLKFFLSIPQLHIKNVFIHKPQFFSEENFASFPS